MCTKYGWDIVNTLKLVQASISYASADDLKKDVERCVKDKNDYITMLNNIDGWPGKEPYQLASDMDKILASIEDAIKNPNRASNRM